MEVTPLKPVLREEVEKNNYTESKKLSRGRKEQTRRNPYERSFIRERRKG